MFLYLLLATAIITTLDTIDDTPTIDPELKEIITLFTATDENVTDESTTKETTIAEISKSTDETCTPAEKQTSIIITNAIEPSMLAYKHWTGTYSPDKFIIAINDVEVVQGASYTIPSTKELVKISYSYSFMNGMRTGAKAIYYQLDENITQAHIIFSWEDQWKVLIDNGTAIKQEEIA